MRLQGINDKLFCVEGGKGSEAVDARTSPDRPGPWEELIETAYPDGTVSLSNRGEDGKEYFLSGRDDGTLTANRPDAGPWERFKKHVNAGVVAYESAQFGTFIR